MRKCIYGQMSLVGLIKDNIYRLAGACVFMQSVSMLTPMSALAKLFALLVSVFLVD